MSPPLRCFYKYSLQTHIENPTLDLLGKTQRLHLSLTLLCPRNPSNSERHLILIVHTWNASVLHLPGGQKGGGELGMLIRNRVLRIRLNVRPGDQSFPVPHWRPPGPQTEIPRFQRFPPDSLESLQLSLFWVRILVLPYPATPVYISSFSLCTALLWSIIHCIFLHRPDSTL